MTQAFSWLSDYITPERAASLLRAAVILAVGIVIAKLIASSLEKISKRRIGSQQAVTVRKISFYLLLTLIIITSLRELGFNLSVLLGAAGILTVAVGFASQTSASNIISGLFLLVDQPFQVGDVIEVGGTTGIVNDIELISVKLRTFQNALVRIPNEEVIKSQVTNYTHFPIRRIDVEVGVAYKEDISKVRKVLLEVADRNPLCLEEPAPLFIYKGYGSSSIDLLLGVWVKKENFLLLMNSIKEEIKAAFDKSGIEIPFPHISVYTGSVTDPFPVRVVNE
ncbi:MAG: mechanosensitive ion channel family protein [Candidatus Glassbacteria bacterium]|nr:mechanosensitive ion channel family protein [Candidatus Glassbacteria bacterium]